MRLQSCTEVVRGGPGKPRPGVRIDTSLEAGVGVQQRVRDACGSLWQRARQMRRNFGLPLGIRNFLDGPGRKFGRPGVDEAFGEVRQPAVALAGIVVCQQGLQRGIRLSEGNQALDAGVTQLRREVMVAANVLGLEERLDLRPIGDAGGGRQGGQPHVGFPRASC